MKILRVSAAYEFVERLEDTCCHPFDIVRRYDAMMLSTVRPVAIPVIIPDIDGV